MRTKLFLLIFSVFSLLMAIFALENKMEIPAYGWFTVSCIFLTGAFILYELEYYLTVKHFDDTMQAKFEKENPHVTESLPNH
jgi:uncharacterized membrane-anchored protein